MNRQALSSDVAEDAASESVQRRPVGPLGRWGLPALIAGVGAAALVVGPLLANMSDDGELSTSPMSFQGYDPLAMQQRLVSAAQADLGKTLPGSAAPAFVAGTADFRELGPGDYASADYMYVLFGDESQHSVKVFSGHATDDIDPDRLCMESETGYQVSCEVTRSPAGDYVVTSVMPLLEAPNLGEGKFTTVDHRTLGAKDLASVHLERNVRVIHAGGYMTSVTERVASPVALTDSAFAVSTDAMEKVALDTSLAIPYPPAVRS